MSDERSKMAAIEPNRAVDRLEPDLPLADSQSWSPSDTDSIVDIQIQANRLFDYMDKLNSFADRAFQSAISQTEWAQRFEGEHQTELKQLRHELELSRAALDDKNIAYAVLEKTTQAQFAKSEERLRELETQLNHREQELQNLTTEIASFLKYQKARDQTESHRDNAADLESFAQEIAALKLALAKRDETIQAKSNALHKVSMDFHAKIQDLEKTVRDNAIRLEQQEARLLEKDAVIQATATKEVEIGKLIKHLSSECDRLSKELQQKTQRLAQFEKDKTPGEVKAWQVASLREEPT